MKVSLPKMMKDERNTITWLRKWCQHVEWHMGPQSHPTHCSLI